MTACSSGDPLSPEMAALRYLREFAAIEKEIYSREMRYATKDEISPTIESRLHSRYLRRLRQFYTVDSAITPKGYCVTVRPIRIGYPDHSFFLDQSGLIRQERSGRPATERSELAQ